MILPEIKVDEFVNKSYDFLATDNVNNPTLLKNYKNDLTEYHQYPDKVRYEFNSRGFRDDEWPENLDGAVWCFGDSAGFGLGLNVDNSFPYLLKNKSQQNVISCCKIMAYNDWMLETAQQIIDNTNPGYIVLQYSWLNRNMKRVLKAAEVEGKLQDSNFITKLIYSNLYSISSDLFDFKYTLDIIKAFESRNPHVKLIHCCMNVMDLFNFSDRLEDSSNNTVLRIDWLDDSRDRSHPGKLTHQLFADKISEKII
jgi:hypothetical protein